MTQFTEATGQRQICAFMLNEQCFGIDVQSVQEVFRFQECTPVPLAPSLVTGLLNLRGQIVLAIDLRKRLGLPERDESQLPTNVVVNTSHGVISLLVDELFDILDLPVTQLEPVPETLTVLEREFISGCYKLNQRLLLMLDTTLLSNIEDCIRQEIDTPNST